MVYLFSYMRIKALPGKANKIAQFLKDISGLPLNDCSSIVRGFEEFPEECYDELCSILINPDLYFEIL